MTFTKGVSGNPRGRPRKNEEMKAVLRRILAEKDPFGRPNKEAVARGLVHAAQNGNIEAAKVIFDRIDGKVKDVSEQNQNVTGEVVVRVVRDRASGAAPLSAPPISGADSG